MYKRQFFTFVSSAIVACLKFLFLLVDFFVKIWLLYAFILFNSPVPVFLKRFAAALLVLDVYKRQLYAMQTVLKAPIQKMI